MANRLKYASLLVFVLAWMAAIGAAQTISSSVVGTVVDPAGAVVPEATVTLTNTNTGGVRTANSDQAGFFRFSNVLGGVYSVNVRATGFRAYSKTGIALSASETRDVGRLALVIGAVTEDVTVTAEAAAVQVASGEKSSLVTGTQLEAITLKGRDFLGLMSTLPGVVDTNRDTRQATANQGALSSLHMSGGRSTQTNFLIDGVSAIDTGSNTDIHYEPNMGGIAEVRVLTSNYQAQFGRMAGGSISVITKSGTQQFHGAGYWSHRHEEFNANNFFSNSTGLVKSPYRFNIEGFSIGGPVFIPRKFNTGKTKLFGFFSREYTRQRTNYGLKYVNMPTQAERAGDFSHSLDTNGKLISIIDPSNNSPFPGNTIPAARINAIGQAMVKFLPAPNYVDPSASLALQRNYQVSASAAYPRRNDILRLDANLSSTLQVFWSYIQDTEYQDAAYGTWGTGNANYQIVPVRVSRPGNGHTVRVSKTFSPTLVNEFVFGRSYAHLTHAPTDDAAVDRSLMGNPPKWWPMDLSNAKGYYERNYIPTVNFTGTPVNGPLIAMGDTPYENTNTIMSFADDVSKFVGKHTLKAGFYVEHSEKWATVQGGNSLYKGAFTFSANPNNPYNSGNSFANALLGNFDSYTESNGRGYFDIWFWNIESYVQDTWRVTPRLTIDAGLRFYHISAASDDLHRVAGFNPASYSPAAAPRLYYSGKDASGARVAIDTVTGQTAPAPLIGQFVPNTGNMANGMKIGGVDGYPPGLYTLPGLSYGPRLGFAWDVSGNGKTAVRGGFGVFYDRPSNSGTIQNLAGNPPITYTPTAYYGNIATFANNQGALGPTNVAFETGAAKPPMVMNYSLGMQRSFGFGTVLDVSYVGNLGRHLLWTRNINAIPIGARFNPANADPTNPGKPRPDNFLRPYSGYGDLNEQEFASTSNYNSLQASAQRRLAKGLMFGVAYTWSKALGTGSGDLEGVSPYFAPRSRNYGPVNFDITHMLVLNYLYEFPKLATKVALFRGAVNGWSLSGTTSFMTGTPFTPSLTMTNGADLTGSTESARVDVVGDPYLPKGDRTFFRNFNPAAFAAPATGSFGNAGYDILRQPGVNNWDLSLGKRFGVGLGESRFLMFRGEFYNAFNHTQFATLDGGARFDATGKQVNGNFGAFASARQPRTITFSLRFNY